MALNKHVRQTKIQREAEGYLELGMSQHALDALARLGDSAESDSHTLFLWGEALRAMEHYRQAIIPLEQAADLAPENLHVWLALGWCYKRTGRINKAISSLERVLDTDSTEALVHYNLACYWSLAGDKHRALEYLSQSLTIDPEYCRLIDDEHDFDPLRDDPDFHALCAELSTDDP